MQRAPFGMANQRPLAVKICQHGRRDLARKRALFVLADILSAPGNNATLKASSSMIKVRKRHADRQTASGRCRCTLVKTVKQASMAGQQAVHLPVTYT